MAERSKTVKRSRVALYEMEDWRRSESETPSRMSN